MSANRIGLHLIMTFVSTYAEFYWLRSGYHSLIVAASNCPQAVIQSKSTFPDRWFSKNFYNDERSIIGPVACQTIEIRSDPRFLFSSIKVLFLIGFVWNILRYFQQQSRSAHENRSAVGDGNQIQIIK